MIRRWWTRLRKAFALRRLFRRAVACVLIAIVLLLCPIAYVELGCRAPAGAQAYEPLITDPAFRRTETNTYLTYPEWHIVFAYDGLAQSLKTGDEHHFDYLRSVAGFWSSTCALMRVARAQGGAETNTRMMIHTIGASFTAEMLAKAAYEETIGRLTAWLRGPRKTPQDAVIAAMASDYAAFLRQTPWYRYPFHQKARELWAAPIEQFARGWERRLGIGLEFEAKRVYARVLGAAVAATGQAELSIRSVVTGIDAAALARIPGVKTIGRRSAGIEIETPRYDRFTRILAEIARQGGAIREIAGNDDIMVSMTVPEGTAGSIRHGTVLVIIKRDAVPGERLLVRVGMADLAMFLNAYPLGDPGLEHVFDY